MEKELDYKAIAEYLYMLIDDIDSASDHARGDSVKYEKTIEKLLTYRRAVGNGSKDGMTIEFQNPEVPYGLTRLFSMKFDPTSKHIPE